MVPAEARPAGMGRFLRPLLSSAEVVVSTSMMSSVMPALACKQEMDRSTMSADRSTLSVNRSTRMHLAHHELGSVLIVTMIITGLLFWWTGLLCLCVLHFMTYPTRKGTCCIVFVCMSTTPVDRSTLSVYVTLHDLFHKEGDRPTLSVHMSPTPVDRSTLSVYVTLHDLSHKEGDMLHCVCMHGIMCRYMLQLLIL